MMYDEYTGAYLKPKKTKYIQESNYYSKIRTSILCTGVVLLIALIIALILNLMTFAEALQVYITFLLAFATILLAIFTRELAIVNEQMRELEERRDLRAMLHEKYDRIRRKIEAAEQLLKEGSVIKKERLRVGGSPPEPENSAIRTIYILADRNKKELPFEHLDRIIKILDAVYIQRKDCDNLGDQIEESYIELEKALRIQLPIWKTELIDILSKLYM